MLSLAEMTMLRLVVACALVGGCISPVMKFGEGKTAKQAQHDTINELGPARLVTGEKWNGDVETRKIRVWADQQYRTQNRNWQKSFEDRSSSRIWSSRRSSDCAWWPSTSCGIAKFPTRR